MSVTPVSEIIFGTKMISDTEKKSQKVKTACEHSQAVDRDGAQGQNRTADTGIFSPLLYRLSYLGMFSV